MPLGVADADADRGLGADGVETQQRGIEVELGRPLVDDDQRGRRIVAADRPQTRVAGAAGHDDSLRRDTRDRGIADAPPDAGGRHGTPPRVEYALTEKGGALVPVIEEMRAYGETWPEIHVTPEQAVEEHIHHMAAFPLAIPLMAGPGAITATILLAGQADARPLWIGVLIGVIVVVSAVCVLCFLAAERIAKLLGTTGNIVLSRLLGVILAALAVQFVVDGVRAALGW